MSYAGGKMLAEVEDGVGLVMFNQPDKLNAMSIEMWQGLDEILTEFARDDGVRVVVLTGAGQPGLRVRRRYHAVRGGARQCGHAARL